MFRIRGSCRAAYGPDLLSLFEHSPSKQCTALIWEVQNALFGSDGKLNWTQLNDERPQHSTIIEVHFWPAFMRCGRQLSGSSSLAVNKWQAVKHCHHWLSEKWHLFFFFYRLPWCHIAVSEREKHWSRTCLLFDCMYLFIRFWHWTRFLCFELYICMHVCMSV